MIITSLNTYVTRAVIINHGSTQIVDFLSLLYHNLIIVYSIKMFTANHNVEINGISSAIYRNEILQSQFKILVKLQLSVICAHITWLILQAQGHICILTLYCVGRYL